MARLLRRIRPVVLLDAGLHECVLLPVIAAVLLDHLEALADAPKRGTTLVGRGLRGAVLLRRHHRERRMRIIASLPAVRVEFSQVDLGVSVL